MYRLDIGKYYKKNMPSNNRSVEEYNKINVYFNK